jgi:uncharacterized protein
MELKTKVFIDTSFLKALADKKDDFYVQAHQIWDKIREEQLELVTTNFIIDETFTLLRVRCGVDVARELYDHWNKMDYGIKIVRVNSDDERNVWGWFWRNWSKLSYTDCTSFAVMNRLGLNLAASFDRHFEEAGFELIST